MAKTQTKKEESPQYNRFERARMIGSRALQIAMGAPFLVKLSKKQLTELKYNPVAIARLEYDKGVLPITVKRPFPKKEHFWHLSLLHPST